MSDDQWRPRDDEFDSDDDFFGKPLFADDVPTSVVPEQNRPAFSFDDASEDLPHWTEPATGEVPNIFSDRSASAAPAEDDDLDVWSGFNEEGPTWSDDGVDVTEPEFADDYGGRVEPVARAADPRGDVRRAERISIGTGPEQAPRSAPAPARQRSARPAADRSPRQGQGARQRPGGPRPRAGAPRVRQGTGRDMPTAIAVGLLIAALFLGALMWRPVAVLAIVVLVCGLATVEFFDRATERGYHPASILGSFACMGAPMAAYWVGESALPLVIAFAFLAAALTFVGGDSLDSSPLPNMAITVLGVTWIGFMGSFAALILGAPNEVGLPHVGTDTMFMIAIGVVANDVGALFVGSAAGRTPLRAWISPNKTLEGFIGGAVATVLAVVVVSQRNDTWGSLSHALALAALIAVLAPLGDLTESMFKRNLGVKDFGTVVPGHGGVLDRFDGFLFVLPATYYLLTVLQPLSA